MEKVDEGFKWLGENQEASKEEFEDVLKDIQKVVDPIIGQVYQQAGGQGYGDYGEYEDYEGYHDDL